MLPQFGHHIFLHASINLRWFMHYLKRSFDLQFLLLDDLGHQLLRLLFILKLLSLLWFLIERLLHLLWWLFF